MNKYVRSTTSMNTISKKSKPFCEIEGNGIFSSSKNLILMVRMVRSWNSLSYWERRDHLRGTGGLQQSSFTTYRPQNNITGHWAVTLGTSTACQSLMRASDQCRWHRWVPGLGGHAWLAPVNTAQGLHSWAAAQAALILVSAEKLKRKWQYLLRKSWMSCWQRQSCIKTRH